MSKDMIVKVSKVFAKFINETAKAMDFKAYATVVAVRSSAYEFVTGTSLWDAGEDYDHMTGTCRVIEVSYPEEYYACRKFLTTYELNREFRRRNVKSVSDLQLMLKDMLEV